MMWSRSITVHVDFPGFTDFVAWLRDSTAQQKQIDAINAELSDLNGRLRLANDKLELLTQEENS